MYKCVKISTKTTTTLLILFTLSLHIENKKNVRTRYMKLKSLSCGSDISEREAIHFALFNVDLEKHPVVGIHSKRYPKKFLRNTNLCEDIVRPIISHVHFNI